VAGTVPKAGGGSYGMDGIPDGLGAFDNANGTFTLLMNHELGNTQGVIRDHGGAGAYVSRFVIGKNSLNVVSGDITDPGSVQRALETHSVTNVIHLAALQVPFCRADPPRGARSPPAPSACSRRSGSWA
jgi:hypothetical protein